MNSNVLIEALMDQLGAMFFVILVIYFALIILLVLSQWKIYVKAGQPGWAVLVPFYNLYVFTQIIERQKWWMLLYFLAFIPFVGTIAVIVIVIMDYIKLSKVFGKDGGYAAGLLLLPMVFFPILAFGSATYQGSKAGANDLLDN